MLINLHFPYEPLAGNQIRLIKLQKAASDQPIACTMEHFPLVGLRQPHFNAFSYVWGDPKDVLPITVNGTIFYVTVTLHAALRRVRTSPLFRGRHEKPTGVGDLHEMLFWIDAICINQNDNTEKSAQVPRMKEIYSSTTMVIAWLGELEKGEDLPLHTVIEITKNLYYGIHIHKKTYREVIRSTEEFPLSQRQPFQQLLAAGVPITPESCTLVLGRLHRRPWFSRVWIIQEAILSHNRMVFMVGRHWIRDLDLDFCCRAWDSSARLTSVYDAFWHSWQSYPLNSITINLRKQGEPTDTVTYVKSLKNLMIKTTGHKSSLPHDQIYGRLSVVGTKFLPQHLLPDYEKSYSEVFHQYAVFFMRQDRGRSLLLTKEHHLTDVPSWVPDFRYMIKSQDLDTGNKSHISISSDGKTLTVRGFKIGKIVYISRRHSCSINDPETVRSAVRAFDAGLVNHMSKQLQVTPERIVRGVWMPLWSHIEHAVTGAQERSGRLYQLYRCLVDTDETIEIHGRYNGHRMLDLSNLVEKMNDLESFVSHNGLSGYSLRRDGSLMVGDNLLDTNELLPKIVLIRPHLGNYLFIGPCETGNYERDFESTEIFNLV